jgi:anti-sigma factor ChrR (cupin superfamily)
MKRVCRLGRTLTAYVDGELSEAQRGRVERHLASCQACARELDSLMASDRILKAASPPSVSGERWRAFGRELSASLDQVDREGRRSVRAREALPVYGVARRRTLALAGACAAVVLAILLLGPVGGVRRIIFQTTGGNECIVESLETYAAGYTPMSFTSGDPEMTVIWVFTDENGGRAPQTDGTVTQ